MTLRVLLQIQGFSKNHAYFRAKTHPVFAPSVEQTQKRRGGSGERGKRRLPPHVNSGTDPAIYSARKISGRPCVPGRLGKNRAQADSLRRGREGQEAWRPEQHRLFTFLPSYLPLVGGSARISAHAGPPGECSARTEPTGPRVTSGSRRNYSLFCPRTPANTRQEEKRRFRGKGKRRPRPTSILERTRRFLRTEDLGRPCVPGRLWKNRAQAEQPPASERR